MRRIWEGICAFIFGLLAGFALLTLAYPPSRQWPADLMVRQDRGRNTADAVVMLMGDVIDRTPHCARLLKKGIAPKIVFVETELNELNSLGYRLPEGETSFRYLQKLGVPKEDIIFDTRHAVGSTFEEVRADLNIIKERLPAAKRLVLCTSWYHSSRAHWIAQKVNVFEYDLKSMPSPKPKLWYAKEMDFLMVFNEYLKWVYYMARY